MIIYKCDLCGKKIPHREIVTVRAVRADISRGFEICEDCYNDLANKAKAIAEGAAEILFADGVKIAESAGDNKPENCLNCNMKEKQKDGSKLFCPECEGLISSLTTICPWCGKRLERGGVAGEND